MCWKIVLANYPLTPGVIYMLFFVPIPPKATRYWWEHEEIDDSLYWNGEPNRLGTHCLSASNSNRNIEMSRFRNAWGGLWSSTHDLMDTCSWYEKYFWCEGKAFSCWTSI